MQGMACIRILHLADAHLGSTTHGRFDSVTGENTRIADFDRALSLCIDRALDEPADLVLFGGDAFPDATPPPKVQQLFARQFRRLADANIPTVLLVGNHDLHSQGQGGASLTIYRSLGVPGFIVGDRIETHCIDTSNGSIQVITLPWLTRSTLMTRREAEGLSAAEIQALLLDRLRAVLEGEIRQLDPTLPTVLLAHGTVDTATYGAERMLSAGRDLVLPLSLLARDAFDYVALGHIHRHQVLCDRPLVVYPGSIERVDFGEEREEKGYCWVTLEKGRAAMTFCPLPSRAFRTVRVDVTTATDPQAELLAAIAQTEVEGAIVRLIYRAQADQVGRIDDRALHEALEVAHSYVMLPDIVPPGDRARSLDLDAATATDPLSVLRAYIATRSDLHALESDLLSAAQALMDADPDARGASWQDGDRHDAQLAMFS